MSGSEPRGAVARRPRDAFVVTLPEQPFLYTIDQVAMILSMPESAFRELCFFAGRDSGHLKGRLHVLNIAAMPDDRPIWRISEQELMVWLRRRGYKPKRG